MLLNRFDEEPTLTCICGPQPDHQCYEPATDLEYVNVNNLPIDIHRDYVIRVGNGLERRMDKSFIQI